MSAIASFRLLSKDKFEEYFKMAHLQSPNSWPKGTYLVPVAAKPMSGLEVQKHFQSDEYKKSDSYKSWQFLKKNSKEPFEYQWGGYMMVYVFQYLKEKKNIDLEKNRLLTGDFQTEWTILDKEIKDKYLDELEPSRFQESELLFYYVTYHEHEMDLMLIRTASDSDYSLKQLKQILSKSNYYDAFPEAGKAMLDGIDIIHKYLKLVDDKSVVMLHIG
jgi:hypothetical protein